MLLCGSGDAASPYNNLVKSREEEEMEQEWGQSYLEISRGDLQHNARTVTDYVGCPVIGVVKCDGYGVSTIEAAAAWCQAGAAMLAVSEPEEAFALREAGFLREDILLLTPTANPFLLERLLAEDIILTVTGPDCALRYVQAAKGRTVRVHVAADTGMGRFGLRWTELEQFRQIYQTPGLQFEGIFSHFSASFQPSGKEVHRQLDRFLSLTETLTRLGLPVGLRHIANSCAALRFPETRLDAVRIGSALVGRLPVHVPVSLRPVGQFRAMVVDCKTLRRGDTTGYAALCRVHRDTTVAIVSLGHQSGFGLEKQPQSFRVRDLLRNLWHLVRTFRRQPVVWYQGQALPVVGRIGTQFTLVATGNSGLRPGEYVSATVDMMLPPPHRKYI